MKRAIKRLQLRNALSGYRRSQQHLDTQTARILDDLLARVASSDERWRYEYVRNLDGLDGPFAERRSRFNRAELLSALVCPELPCSEFGSLWLDDEGVRREYERFMDPGNWHAYDRAYMLAQLLLLTRHLEGDYAEMGVYKGGSAVFMCREAQHTGAQVLLFDSFEGLSEPDAADGAYWEAGNLAISAEQVAANLAEFDNFVLCTGWIPDCFADQRDRRFRFVHIDVDLAQPTLDSLEFAYPRLVPGGVLVLDDHGSPFCPGAREVTERFFAGRPEPIINMTTGAAFVVKQSR